MHLLNLVCGYQFVVVVVVVVVFSVEGIRKGYLFCQKNCLFPAWKQSFSP